MHTILIDGNNWGFAGMANPRLSSGEKDTQAIFSVLHKVRNVMEEYPHSNVIVLWDGKSWRKDIYSEYKANREKTEKDTQAREAYYQQKKDILLGLELLGVRQLWGSNMEADDMAAILSDKFATDGHVVTLMTADKDWQQLVRKNVKWVDNINLKMCDIGNFERVTGFKDREQFIEAKCILGDAGDNIKGINGIGPKALENIYKGYSSFAHFLTQMDFGRDYHMDLWKAEHGKVMPKVLREIDTSAAWAKVKENLELVDLHTLARPKIEKVIDTKGKLDAAKFNEFCERNAFHSIRRNMDAFLEGFKQNPYVTK